MTLVTGGNLLLVTIAESEFMEWLSFKSAVNWWAVGRDSLSLVSATVFKRAGHPSIRPSGFESASCLVSTSSVGPVLAIV